MESRMEFDALGTILVEATRIGVISKLSDIDSIDSVYKDLLVPRSTQTRVSLAEEYPKLKDLRKFIDSVGVYPTGEDKDKVLWRTLIVNSERGTEGEATESQHEAFLAFKFVEKLSSGSPKTRQRLINEEFRTFRAQGMSRSNGQVLDDETAEISRFLSATETKAARFGQVIRDTAVYLRPFATSTHYVGQVPHEAQIGDIIVVISGAPTPFVLRPKGDAFSLIGCCYVHGVMKGEALRSDRFHPETIRIV